MRKVTVLRTFAITAILLTMTGPFLTVQGLQEKTVVFAQQAGFAFWDPSTNFDVTSVVLVNIYESLLYMNRPGSAEVFGPGLAERWETSEDALTWDFYLREGVKFHDGSDFTAESVKYSYERSRDIGAGPSYIWWPVDTIEAVDTYHVRVTLNTPYPFDSIAASGYGAWVMCPNPEHDTEWYESGNACGTGPYMLESWGGIAGDTVLVKNPNWWGIADPSQRDPYFDRVIYRVISEDTTQQLLLLSGDIDMADGDFTDTFEELEKEPDLVVEKNPSTWTLEGMLNNKKFPTNITDVRKALSWATPYDDIIDAMKGLGKQMRGAIPSFFFGYSEEVFQYSYDLDKAAQLLDDAGFEINPATGRRDGLGTILLDIQEGMPPELKTVQLVADSLDQLGVDTKIESLQWAPRWERAKNPETAPHMFIYYWWATLLDSWDYLGAQFHTPSDYGVVFELAHYENPEFDTLIDDAQVLSATDKDAALEKFIQAQNILMEQDAASIMFFEQTNIHVYRSDIKGYVDNPMYAGKAAFFKEIYREEVVETTPETTSAVSEFNLNLPILGLLTTLCFVTLVEMRKKRH